MCYMSTFAVEEEKVAVYSSLSLLLGQLAVLSKFEKEVGLVAGGADRQLSGIVGGPRVVVVVRTRVAFVQTRVVFSAVCLPVGLHGFVRFVGFTGTGGVLVDDFGVTFPIVSIDRLDEGMGSQVRLSGLLTLAISSLMQLGSPMQNWQ